MVSLTDKELKIQLALGSLSDDMKANIASKTTSVDIIRILADDEGDYVKQGVARNTNTPIDVLRVLGDDDNLDIRCEVASNSSTTIDILNMIYDGVDDDHYDGMEIDYVKDTVAYNSKWVSRDD